MMNRRDDPLFEALRETTNSAPDVTRSVMGRLGYMRAAPAVVRRAGRRRCCARAGMTLAAALAIAIGVTVHQRSETVRRPSDVTLPGALQRDVEQRDTQFRRAIDFLRAIPARSGEGIEQRRPHDTVHVAMGPMRWL